MRTDGLTDVKNVIVDFRNFARGSKTYQTKNKFSVDKKIQLDVTFCILYFSSNS